ncbi:alpha/beta hydrolase [Duganella sp. PWIR1]
MKSFQRPIVLSCLLLAAFNLHAATLLPKAVVTDPVRDRQHPPANQQLLIPSAGQGMNALIMKAAGTGPKPTLLLLHGLPGNEQNLDLAQAVRRAGWNVVTMHYRGSWGSPGNFSIEGAVEDAAAAMTFLLQPETAARYGVDPRRLYIGGHSMGGMAAALYAAHHADAAGLVLIDAWNAGLDGQELVANPEMTKDFVAGLDDLGNSLAGTDAERLAEEIKRHATDWNLIGYAPALAEKPALVIGAVRGGGEANKELADAIRAQRKGKITSLAIDSDHAFADHRIALSAAVVNWLQRR